MQVYFFAIILSITWSLDRYLLCSIWRFLERKFLMLILIFYWFLETIFLVLRSNCVIPLEFKEIKHLNLKSKCYLRGSCKDSSFVGKVSCKYFFQVSIVNHICQICLFLRQRLWSLYQNVLCQTLRVRKKNRILLRKWWLWMWLLDKKKKKVIC